MQLVYFHLLAAICSGRGTRNIVIISLMKLVPTKISMFFEGYQNFNVNYDY
jgi:hypothetical protein